MKLIKEKNPMKKQKFATINRRTNSLSLLRLLALLTVALFFVGCSGENNDEPGGKGSESQLEFFTDNLHKVLVDNCGGCHSGSSGEPADTPDFAHQDAAKAYSVVVSESLVDLDDVNNSRLIEKVLLFHQCSSQTCDFWATEIKNGINKWIKADSSQNESKSSEEDTEENAEKDNSTDNETEETTETEQEIEESNLEKQISAFNDNLHSTLMSRCGTCHAGAEDEPAGTPDFAHVDAATAYSVISSNTLVNLNNPANSRLVKKVLTLHKCTQPTCNTWAGEIEDGVSAWADMLAEMEIGEGTVDTVILSKSLTLAQGVKDEGQGRIEDSVIAKYEFKTGNGQTAFDTSDVAPALNLTLSEDVIWLPARGIEMTDPNMAEITKAVGTAEDSKKLYDRIAGPDGSQQYSIEAWIINDNTALDGPARIVSYSKNASNRNFTMGQDTSYYNFRSRSDLTGANGSSPALESDNDANDLKPQLQHVVFTFDTEDGRNIFVNGSKTKYERFGRDPSAPADISNWDPNYQFVLGNEVPDGTKRQWLGKMLFVAIHDRALTAEEILQNALEGIGEKFIMDFDVSDLVSGSASTTSKIRFTVSELDDYSYVFATPIFLTDMSDPNIPVKNIRIAVNGNVPAAAQAFRNVDVVVTGNDTKLSTLGAVIPKDTGPEADTFSLVFEVLGNNTNVVIAQVPEPIPDLSIDDPSPENGVRTFAKINNTMAVLTGVAKSRTKETYSGIEQQLPGTPQLGSFVTANQMGVFKLALEYCNALVESNALRTNFFGNSFEFNAPVVTAFSSPEKRNIVIDNLVNKMVGTDFINQPTLAEIQPDLDQLIDELSANCNVAEDCDAVRTRTIVKATCAAVLASAAVTVD